MSRTTKAQQAAILEAATKSGEIIKHFLEGGNGGVASALDGVRLALGRVAPYLQPGVFDALIGGAGLVEIEQPMGGTRLVPVDPLPSEYAIHLEEVGHPVIEQGRTINRERAEGRRHLAYADGLELSLKVAIEGLWDDDQIAAAKAAARNR